MFNVGVQPTFLFALAFYCFFSSHIHLDYKLTLLYLYVTKFENVPLLFQNFEYRSQRERRYQSSFNFSTKITL